jgi:hypothetical protein
VEERVRFYEGIGLAHTLAFHRQKPEELAHYARACVDILFKFPFSKRDEAGELKGEELEGIAARSDFDLSQHARFSGKPWGCLMRNSAPPGANCPRKRPTTCGALLRNRKGYLERSGSPENRRQTGHRRRQRPGQGPVCSARD